METKRLSGVVKTHRLLLSSTDIQGPQLTPLTTQSHVTIGPRALKDILDHFPHTKGTKSDPELVWLFGIDDIKIKSMELTGDARGMSSLLIYTPIIYLRQISSHCSKIADIHRNTNER